MLFLISVPETLEAIRITHAVMTHPTNRYLDAFSATNPGEKKTNSDMTMLPKI